MSIFISIFILYLECLTSLVLLRVFGTARGPCRTFVAEKSPLPILPLFVETKDEEKWSLKKHNLEVLPRFVA